ncbi:MAG: hypothetical protein HC816_19005 [Leptolyngbyaceae cyanobacterium RM1_1_2]|nr:hypothetical protein [Leptolyngbyaceae cyanobacterium RM1_1_2]
MGKKRIWAASSNTDTTGHCRYCRLKRGDRSATGGSGDRHSRYRQPRQH